jgi:hypothetical protein
MARPLPSLETRKNNIIEKFHNPGTNPKLFNFFGVFHQMTAVIFSQLYDQYPKSMESLSGDSMAEKDLWRSFQEMPGRREDPRRPFQETPGL